MPAKKYFTIEEAEKALPKVKRLLGKLHTLKAQVNFLADQKEAPIELTDPFSEDEIYRFAFMQEIKLNRELHKHTYDFFTILDQLNELGCIVKDLDAGLVDFPHRLNGRDVWLCWKEGEHRITSWHDVDGGFENRRPIIDLDDVYDTH